MKVAALAAVSHICTFVWLCDDLRAVAMFKLLVTRPRYWVPGCRLQATSYALRVTRYRYNSYSGVVVARLPFTPFRFLQGLTHRNLEGEDFTECSVLHEPQATYKKQRVTCNSHSCSDLCT